MRGRIYERRCDLSPGGRHLIYFAMNGKWQSETKGSWTAISRAPWLKAIVLYGKGDCWNGGGLFTSNDRYWLNGDCAHFLLHDSGELRRDTEFTPAGSYGGECPSVYYRRLQRDGWVLKEHLTAGPTSGLTVFEKPLSDGWLLRKYAHAEVGAPPGKGCYWDEHELENLALNRRLKLPEWEWAEWDNEALVWAEGGKLHRAVLEAAGPAPPIVLHDFNGMQFMAREAPY